MARQTLNILSEEEIFSVHEQLIQRDGGLPGLRIEGSLSSIVQRVSNHALYDTAFRNPWRLAALLAYAIAVGHPFNDGNKRTALVAGIAMLSINKCSHPEPMPLAKLLVAAADGEADKDQFIKQFVALAKHRDS